MCIGKKIERERGVCSPDRVYCILAWENGDRIVVGTGPSVCLWVCACVPLCDPPLGAVTVHFLYCERAVQTGLHGGGAPAFCAEVISDIWARRHSSFSPEWGMQTLPWLSSPPRCPDQNITMSVVSIIHVYCSRKETTILSLSRFYLYILIYIFFEKMLGTYVYLIPLYEHCRGV